MKKFLFAIALAMMPAALLAQPAIDSGGVANVASYKQDIAQGSIFVVFGRNMGPATLTRVSALPYPTDLVGTQITFTPAAGGSAVNARVVYTSAGQLAGLLPSNTLVGDYDVRVVYNGQTSAPERVKVVVRNFGYVTSNASGGGTAQATYGGLNLNRFTSGTTSFDGNNWEYRPARPGDTLVLWGTGIGPDASSDVNGGAGAGDQTAAGQVRVIINDTIEVVPAYAGRSPQFPGTDQVNFTLPTNTPLGCTISLQVRAGGTLSNRGSLSLAAPGQAECTHPVLTTEQLRKLDAGGTLAVAAFDLSKLSIKLTAQGLTIDSKTENASGGVYRYRVDQVGDAAWAATPGVCQVWRRKGGADDVLDNNPAVGLDAGPQWTLNGPNASNLAIPMEATSKLYNKSLYTATSIPGLGDLPGTGTPTIAAGTYTLTGPGGTEAGAFTATQNVPGTFTWTNEAAVSVITRSSGQVFQWTGGGTGYVTVSGYAAVQAGGTETDPILDAAGFTCTAEASAGTLTVPSSILTQLPAAGNNPPSNFGAVFVLATPGNTTGRFSVPLLPSGTTDFGFFAYSIGSGKSIEYR